MIVDKINAYLAQDKREVDDKLGWAIKEQVKNISGYVFENQFINSRYERQEGTLWISEVAKCARQIAYKYHGMETEGRGMDGRANFTFYTGDIIEIALVNVARLAGVQIMSAGLDQLRLTRRYTSKNDDLIRKVTGRCGDGIVFNDYDDRYPKFVMAEFKSMQSFKYEEWERGGYRDDEIYMGQIYEGLDVVGLEYCCLVYYNKNNGMINEVMIKKDEGVVKVNQQNVISVFRSTPESLPDRKFSPDEKGILPWNCLYCDSYKTCWPKSFKILSGKSYKLNSGTTPKPKPKVPKETVLCPGCEGFGYVEMQTNTAGDNMDEPLVDREKCEGCAGKGWVKP